MLGGEDRGGGRQFALGPVSLGDVDNDGDRRRMTFELPLGGVDQYLDDASVPGAHGRADLHRSAGLNELRTQTSIDDRLFRLRDEVQEPPTDDLLTRAPNEMREVIVGVADRPVVPDNDGAGDVLFGQAAEFTLFLTQPFFCSLALADIEDHPDRGLLAAESRHIAVDENLDRRAVVAQKSRIEVGRPFAAGHLRHKPFAHCRPFRFGNELQHRPPDDVGGLIAEHPRKVWIDVGQRPVRGDDVDAGDLLFHQCAEYRSFRAEHLRQRLALGDLDARPNGLAGRTVQLRRGSLRVAAHDNVSEAGPSGSPPGAQSNESGYGLRRTNSAPYPRVTEPIAACARKVLAEGQRYLSEIK